jgi:hypothetical protein
MKRISCILIPVAIVGLLSCSENEQKDTITTTPINTAIPTATNNTTQAATGELNPAHGEPNHRCDIPVGAPLDAPAQPKLNAPQPLTPPIQAPQGAVAAGTNPPHGQPGHDCSIAVGAPLNK